MKNIDDDGSDQDNYESKGASFINPVNDSSFVSN